MPVPDRFRSGLAQKAQCPPPARARRFYVIADVAWRVCNDRHVTAGLPELVMKSVTGLPYSEPYSAPAIVVKALVSFSRDGRSRGK
jgi:hypothetical protein